MNNEAKKKAKELIEWFQYQICSDNGISENASTLFCAKQCALKVCDEALNIKSVDKDYDLIDYFQQVKTEIENYE